jgi:pimeloyl-ACP methyl ester carboxylesterase
MNESMAARRPSSLVVGGTRTHVLDHEGPAGTAVVVCLHGFGGSARNWDLVAPCLAQHRRVIAIDLLGHGLTQATPRPTTDAVLDQIGEVLHEVVTPSPAHQVVLVGSSFGGTMALQFAARHTELVHAVVVLGAPTPRRLDRRHDHAMSLKRWLISAPGVSGFVFRRTAAMSPQEVVVGQLVAAGADPARLDRATLHEAVALQARRHHDRAGHDSQQQLLGSLLRLLEQGQRFAGALAPVAAPVLWLQGEDDPLVPEHLARAFVDRHPAWKYATRAGVGHVPALTDPTWVSSCIHTWLGDIGGT